MIIGPGAVVMVHLPVLLTSDSFLIAQKTARDRLVPMLVPLETDGDRLLDPALPEETATTTDIYLTAAVAKNEVHLHTRIATSDDGQRMLHEIVWFLSGVGGFMHRLGYGIVFGFGFERFINQFYSYITFIVLHSTN